MIKPAKPVTIMAGSKSFKLFKPPMIAQDKSACLTMGYDTCNVFASYRNPKNTVSRLKGGTASHVDRNRNACIP